MHRRLLFAQGNSLLKYLIGYYKFNGNLLDSANNPSNLASIPNLTFTNGKINLGVDLNSTNIPASALNAANAFKFSFSTGSADLPFSFSFWMNYKGGSSETRRLFGRNALGSSDVATNAEYAIQISTLNILTVIKYSLGSNANSVIFTVVDPIPLNEMIHISITDDAAGNTLIYINNVLKTTNTATTGSGFVRFSITTSSRTGFGNTLGGPNAARVFYGILDEFAIFKGYALKPADVAWLYNSGNGKEIR